MLPHTHFFASLIVWYALKSSFGGGLAELAATLVSGVLVDLDGLVIRDHRRAVTHTLTFWLCLSLPLSLLEWRLAVYLLAGAVSHIVLDMIDFSVRPLYPLSDVWVGLNLTQRRFPYLNPREHSHLEFALCVLRTPEVVALDVAISLLGVFLLVAEVVPLLL